jgi:hypothetical protein
LAFQADLFFNVSIDDFYLKSLSGGFHNMTVDGALIAKLEADGTFNSGYSHNEDLTPPTTILDFNVGPIPVRLWFEIPLNSNSMMQVNAEASLGVGAYASWNLGDFYVSWVDGKGWSHVNPTPSKLSFSPYVSALQATFTANAQLEWSPTFSFHVDSVFFLDFNVDPVLYLTANGTLASKRVCAEGQYEVSVTGSSQLDINIPFVYFHAGENWGPDKVYDSGKKEIAGICVNV